MCKPSDVTGKGVVMAAADASLITGSGDPPQAVSNSNMGKMGFIIAMGVKKGHNGPFGSDMETINPSLLGWLIAMAIVALIGYLRGK